DVVRVGGDHVEPLARDALDEGVARPGALLELQATPFGIESVAHAIEALELHEQRAGAVLTIDRCGRRQQQRAPQYGEHPRQCGSTAAHAMRSATRSRALRLRGLAAISCAEGRSLWPTRRSGGRASGGGTGRRFSAGSVSDWARIKSFTIRSSSEWKLI